MINFLDFTIKKLKEQKMADKISHFNKESNNINYFSNLTIVSIWWVWGNISTGITSVILYIEFLIM